MNQRILLGVNIDHVATLRQARGTTYPDPLQAALTAQDAGADGITVHLREDRRHIQDEDVRRLKETLLVPLNLEMAATDEMARIAVETRPAECCLVPERRQELTTEGGLDAAADINRYRDLCADLGAAEIEVSLFIDPELKQVDAALEIGAPIMELHTGQYAMAPSHNERLRELRRLETAAAHGLASGLQVNAGHGLHYHNVASIAAIEGIRCLNIGHAIVAHAVMVGFSEAVRKMKDLMTMARAASKQR
jgi:pyridoxine 5-phosphate synthase